MAIRGVMPLSRGGNKPMEQQQPFRACDLQLPEHGNNDL